MLDRGLTAFGGVSVWMVGLFGKKSRNASEDLSVAWMEQQIYPA